MDSPEHLSDLLDTSLRQYTAMVELLQRLQGELDFTSMAAATTLFAEYRELEKEARLNDHLLVKMLKEKGDTALDAGGMIKIDMLKHLQTDVQGEIGNAVAQAGNIKMLLKEEMGSMVKGRNAMQGYRSHTARNGKILSGSY